MAKKKKSSLPKGRSRAKPKNKLSYDKSLKIVLATIRNRTRSSVDVTKSSRLGELLPVHELHALRFDLHKHAKSHGLQFDPTKILIEPHYTVHKVAAAISSLAGDATVDD